MSELSGEEFERLANTHGGFVSTASSIMATSITSGLVTSNLLQSAESIKADQSLKTSIGNRVIESITRLLEDVNLGKLPLEHGHYMVFMLVDTFSPFCSFEVAKLMSDVEENWRNMMNEQKRTIKKNLSFEKMYNMEDAF